MQPTINGVNMLVQYCSLGNNVDWIGKVNF